MKAIMLLMCLEVLREGFFCFPVRLERGLQETIVSSFLKFSASSQNAEFHIYRSHMEIGLSEVIKFCTRKLIKRTHFIFPLKIINLFQDTMPNFSTYLNTYD